MDNLTATAKYFWLTLKHKAFVLRAGLKTRTPLWRLILHDINKFHPMELPHYGRQFFGTADDPEGFIRCWIHHQNREDHHWEYWIPRTGHNRCNPPYPDRTPVPMPEGAVKEMIADWLGAGRAYGGLWPTNDSWPWFEENWLKIQAHLHALTIQRVRKVFEDLDMLRLFDRVHGET